MDLTRVVRPEAALAVDQERLALRGGELLLRVSDVGIQDPGFGLVALGVTFWVKEQG